jgi:hypothetical protein
MSLASDRRATEFSIASLGSFRTRLLVRTEDRIRVRRIRQQ